LDTIPLLDTYVNSPGVFHQLMQQVEYGLLKAYQNIEENVLGKERRVIEHREITAAMMMNAMTAGAVTGNLGAVAAGIAQIATVKQRLKALGGSSTIDFNSLRTYVR
jgi:hypothetical protein